MNARRAPAHDLWGPLSLWGHVWRTALAALLSLWSLAIVLDGEFTRTPGLRWPVLAVVLGVLSFAVLPWHRRHPVAMALALHVVGMVTPLASGPALLTLTSVATRRRWREIVPVTVVAALANLASDRIYPTADGDPWWFTVILDVVVLSVVVAWGMYIGVRRDLLATWRWRAQTAESEQSHRVAQAQHEERARIAREMHDVLAHRMSLVSMHAGALAYRQDLTPEQVREEARLIQRTSTEALRELRDVLGALRDTSSDAPDASVGPPQPTLADVPDLVDEARGAGLVVDLHDETPPDARATGPLTRHGYRILQEALTNARKHAPGSHVHVGLTGAPGGTLALEVVNGPVPLQRTPGTTEPVPGAGLGLIGLAERATLVGGTLTHGATADGGYRVSADLPWPEETP